MTSDYIDDEYNYNIDENLNTIVVDKRDTLYQSSDDSVKTNKSGIFKKQTVYFNDSQRKIDFVICFKDIPENDPDKDLKEYQRDFFFQRLNDVGLQIEIEDKENSHDKESYFAKIHAPWQSLTVGAEFLNFRKPIKYNKIDYIITKLAPETYIIPCLKFSSDVEPVTFTMVFNEHLTSVFDIPHNHDDFFTDAERSYIVSEFLQRAEFPLDCLAEETSIGCQRLVERKVFEACFCLHDTLYNNKGELSDRHFLKENWANFRLFSIRQPMVVVRRYFGEKVAIYFAWLGFYTNMLILPAIMGALTVLYGLVTIPFSGLVKAVCYEKTASNIILCPRCDLNCPFQTLKSSCLFAKISHVLDNNMTVFFSIFMSLWATFFLHFWKRREKRLQHDWNIQGYKKSERLRPEYEEKALNDVHRKDSMLDFKNVNEQFLPFWVVFKKQIVSIAIVLLMLALVLTGIFGVIVYGFIVRAVYYAMFNSGVAMNAKILTSITSATLNVVMIETMNFIYKKIAYKLTIMESLRTYTQFENSLTVKMFLFKFVNYYGSLFYIAFFKGSFIGRPGDKNYYFLKKYRQDECDPSGCMVDLFLQLIIIMAGKQVMNNCIQTAIPYLKKKILKWKGKLSFDWASLAGLYNGDFNSNTCWEIDYELHERTNIMFQEYLRVVIQYGFIILFGISFPLAPIFALFNNYFEMRLDAIKYLKLCRRPIASKTQDIGAWYSILQGLTFVGILTNGFIIAFTSDFIPRMIHTYDIDPNKASNFVMFKLSLFNTSDYKSGVTGPNPDHWYVYTKNDNENDNNNDDDDDNLNGGGLASKGKNNLRGRNESGGGINLCFFSGYYDYKISNSSSSSNNTVNTYTTKKDYWLITFSRIAFVIVFEHSILLFKWLISFIVPIVPQRVRQMRYYQDQIVKRIVFKRKKEEIRKSREIERQDSNILLDINAAKYDRKNTNGGGSTTSDYRSSIALMMN